MHAAHADWTITWRALGGITSPATPTAVHSPHSSPIAPAATPGSHAYRARLRAEHSDDARRRARMDAANPKYVLRTWMAHEAITAAQAGDYAVIDRLMQTLQSPVRGTAGPRGLGHRRTRLGWVDRAQLLVVTPRRARWRRPLAAARRHALR